MGFNSKKIIKNAEEMKKNAGMINTKEGAMVVAPAKGSFDDIDETATGLTFQAVVESNFSDSAPKGGDEVTVTLNGWKGSTTAGDILAKLEQSATRKITTDLLVLESALSTEDGKVTATHARKAGGEGRMIQEGIMGATTIVSPYIDDKNRRRMMTIREGDNYAPKMERLQKQYDRLLETYSSGDEDAIKENRIQVKAKIIYPEAAIETTNPENLAKALMDIKNEGATSAQLRIHGGGEGFSTSVYLGKDDVTVDQLLENIDESLARRIKNNDKIGEFIEKDEWSVEVIPETTLYMANNKTDATRNATLNFVRDYINASDEKREVLGKYQGSSQYMPKVAITSTMEDKESGGIIPGGFLHIERGATTERRFLSEIATEALPEGYEQITRPKTPNLAGKAEEHDEDEKDAKAEHSADANMSTPADDMNDIPDFGDVGTEKKSRRMKA